MAARCLSYHQAASWQHAIRALATAPLRRLTLSVLFTIATNSYQTTCTVSKRTSIKGNTPMQDTDRITDRCKNIALPQTSFAGSKKNLVLHSLSVDEP